MRSEPNSPTNATNTVTGTASRLTLNWTTPEQRPEHLGIGSPHRVRIRQSLAFVVALIDWDAERIMVRHGLTAIGRFTGEHTSYQKGICPYCSVHSTKGRYAVLSQRYNFAFSAAHAYIAILEAKRYYTTP